MTTTHEQTLALDEREIEDLARIEFESAMSFGISLDNFERLARTVCKRTEVAATKPLEEEIERLKTVPMKYRRMAFNAQLQDENNELRQQLKAAQEKIAELQEQVDLQIPALAFKQLQEQLAIAEQRVAEACTNLCKSKADALLDSSDEHSGYLRNVQATSYATVAKQIHFGEYRKFMKVE